MLYQYLGVLPLDEEQSNVVVESPLYFALNGDVATGEAAKLELGVQGLCYPFADAQ